MDIWSQESVFTPITDDEKLDTKGETEDGSILSIDVDNNRRRLAVHPVDWCVKCLRLIPLESHGDSQMRVFSFEVQ